MWLYNFHFVAHDCKGASHVHVSWFSGQKVNCSEILQEWWSTVSQISYCTCHLGKVSVTGFHIWRKLSLRKSIRQLHSLLDRSLFPLPLTYNPSIKNMSCLRIHYLKYFPCSYYYIIHDHTCGCIILTVSHDCKGASHVHVGWYSGQKVNCSEMLQECWSTAEFYT